MRLTALARDMEISGGDPGITGITEDSRKVEPGMLFVAVRGTGQDGHAYIRDAVERGAVAVAAERLDDVPPGVAAIRAASGRRALAVLAARFHGDPARALRLIGFTGTFGKTSTSAILRDLLRAGGMRPGVLGSLGARYDGFHDPGSGLTTPAPVELHRALRGLADAGADTVVMEVTSHALRTERVAGLRFSGGLLAAIQSGEHTDFHGSFADYVAAKRLFLDYLAADALLAYDADNDAARRLAGDARVARRLGFSLEGRPVEVRFDGLTLDAAGARFTIRGPAAGAGRALHSPLLGRGHLRNVALALTYALGAGVTLDAAAGVLPALLPLRRRMERYGAAGRNVLDDTAAHPESFRATFEVAALQAAPRTVVVYAVRGNRGVDINRRNALAIADLCREFAIDRLVVTAAGDAVTALDRVSAEEAEAARAALDSRGCACAWHETLAGAIREALDATRPGDLLMLTGAQGMNEGKRMLELGSGGTSPRTTSTSTG